MNALRLEVAFTHVTILGNFIRKATRKNPVVVCASDDGTSEQHDKTLSRTNSVEHVFQEHYLLDVFRYYTISKILFLTSV